MKRRLVVAILFTVCFPAFPQVSDSLSYISLKPAEFFEELAIVPNPLIVDVREFFEFRRSRLKDAINIPSSGSIDMAADTIGKETHLFLYCTSGFRSKKVARRFAEKGFIHVYSLEGGISEWRKQGYKVDRRKVRR